MKRPVKRHEVQQPLDQSYRFIPLTQGQNAIVDAVDFAWLNQWNWFAGERSTGDKGFVATRSPDGRHAIYMHREILSCKEEEEGDHINHDTLDNRRTNLRRCTPAQNCQNKRRYRSNKSGFKGVWWCEAEKKWRAYIASNKRRFIIGRFDSAKEAAHAYDDEAKKLHGEFAHLNFPTI